MVRDGCNRLKCGIGRSRRFWTSRRRATLSCSRQSMLGKRAGRPCSGGMVGLHIYNNGLGARHSGASHVAMARSGASAYSPLETEWKKERTKFTMRRQQTLQTLLTGVISPNAPDRNATRSPNPKS